MGLFGFKKQQSNGIDKGVLKFLEEADRIYIRAYETRSIVLLKDHFCRECVIKLSRIIAANAAGRFFSNEKFRTTKWSLCRNADNSESVYLKEVSYDKIKVAGSYNISISEDYKEEWTVLSECSKLLVVDIELLKENQ